MIIKITDTAYGGNGVGRMTDGKAIFVPYTVTGDEIRAEIIEDKGSYAIGKLIELVQASSHRIEPACQYHGLCGGCQFSHIDYEAQLEIKHDIVLQALRKHSQHKEIAETIRITSATPFDYRIRANIRIFNGQVGFFKSNSHDFIPVENCPVIASSLWKKCSQFAAAYDGTGAIAVMENAKGQAIALIDGNMSNAHFDGLSNGKEHIGLPHLEYSTPAGIVPIAYGGFFQSNKFLNDEFQRYAASLAAGGSILELYAGSGFFTAALMQQGNVSALELNPTAAKLGRQYGYPIRTANVSEIQKEKTKYDTIFLDPPRDGVDKKTLAAVLAIAPERIVYVSCNPMTAARDLLRLDGRYKIASIALFDMFPQTYHIETVSLLQRI